MFNFLLIVHMLEMSESNVSNKLFIIKINE